MSRTVVLSTSKLNRKGFRLLSKGGDAEQFRKNPILLFNHSRPWRGTHDEVLPLGTVQNVRIEDDEWKGELEFDMDDPFARRVAQKWDKGIYKMVSVGITPVEFSEAVEHVLPGQRYATVTRWRLDEVSVVDIGANDDALSIKNAATGKYVTLGDDNDLSFLPIINQNSKLKMENISVKLGLAKDASEEQIISAIEDLKARNTALQASEAEIKLAAIKSAVDGACKQRRITEKQRTHFETLGQKLGLDDLTTTLAAIDPAVKPTEFVAGSQQAASDKKWTDYTAEELETLRADDTAAYKLLFDKEYGFTPQL